ncbi:MAG: hypothetical protein KJ052_05195, partial [Candidatus Hydrogenedentes bacterium]|nr:hypothetical protein [Candidatus Hydrogenedentota bacterium]
PEFEFSDQVMEIPLIIAGPGIPQGRRVEALVQNADMVPTLVELLGVDSEATFDGKSLLGLMNDPTAPPLHKYVFYRYRAHMTFGQPGMVLRDTQYKYNFMPGEGSPTGEDEENLWTAPDNIESRQEVTAQYPEVLAGMRQYLQENIMPKWKAFEELPYTTPAPFYEGLPGQGEPEDAYVSRIAHSMMDNRWTLDASTLESAGWREDAPPITLRLEVPNETYQVFMQIRSIADLGGHPASAFRYRAQGDTEFKTIIADDGTGEYKLIDIGTYTVDSGSFVITLDEGSPTHWALAKEFRFVPVALIEESLSTEEEMERAEQIRALGYVE